MRPNPKPVHIGFEDEYLLVAWKPHGLLTSGNSGRTFLHAVKRTLAHSPATDVLTCHRLDFGTSGWVVFGKNKQAARAIGILFESRAVRKRYVALVHGHAPAALTLAWPLDGKPAETRVVRLAKGRIAGAGPVSFVEAKPITGRTHQIRRHLYNAGHGIVGDEQYGVTEKRYVGKGLFLCAYALEFEHPIQPSERIRLESAPSKKFRKLPFVHQSEFVQRFPLSSHE